MRAGYSTTDTIKHFEKEIKRKLVQNSLNMYVISFSWEVFDIKLTFNGKLFNVDNNIKIYFLIIKYRIGGLKVFKKLAIYLCSFMLFLLMIPERGYANTQLTLKAADLNVWGVEPNELVSTSMGKFMKRYPKLDFSKVDDGYITGDPTPNMAYFIEFYTDSKERVIGIEYENFVLNKGLKFTTSKGIKMGSTIQNVLDKYGKKPKETTTKNPEATYLTLTYPITIKETKQKGTMTFMLRHGKKEKRSKAVVYGYQYKLEPLKEKVVEKNAYYNPAFGGKESATYAGKTVKAGMTKKQVMGLLGKPNEINEPMGGTASSRTSMKELLGADFFNSVDIEHWNYVRATDAYGGYEAVVVVFNYQDRVQEVLDM